MYPPLADAVSEREVLMKWFPPLVELRRGFARYAARSSAVRSGLTGAVLLLCGCSTLPLMQSSQVQPSALHVAMTSSTGVAVDYSDAEKLRRSELPLVPDFDVPAPPRMATADPQIEVTGPPASVTTPSVTTPAVTTPAVTTPAVTTPAVTTPAVTTPAVTTPAVTTPAVTTPAVTTPAVTTPAVTAPLEAKPAIPGAGQNAVARVQSVSPTQLPTLRIDAPKPFAWTPIGKTSGNRSFQTVTIGDEGYRALVIGSVAGNDLLAVELVDQLAHRLHEGKTILGGFHATLVRTLNPDGEALDRILNEKGQYINHGFPKDNGMADGNQPVEVSFLLERIETLKPQRLIHVRTIESESGVIAASSSCLPTARVVAEWLGFRVISLPERAVSGSLERYLASTEDCEVMTFAVPSTAKKNELWDRYGDALQNLLMGEDQASRELARQKSPPSSANIQDSHKDPSGRN
jgi:hypothetical protein